MTRLISDQIRSIPETIKEYDEALSAKTGVLLRELAAEATQINITLFDAHGYRVSVIPVTSGLGTIPGFSEAVRSIASHLGFHADIAGSNDVGGLVEAYESGADIAILADDYLYAAINLNTRKTAPNNEATARGYATALDKMAGGLSGKEVLLIGAGAVGKEAAGVLLAMGARLIISDLDKRKESLLAKTMASVYRGRVRSGLTLKKALARKPLIYDASPAENHIQAGWLSEDTLIAAPGIPLGLNDAVLAKVEKHLIHDPLQIGTAVMLFSALTHNCQAKVSAMRGEMKDEQ